MNLTARYLNSEKWDNLHSLEIKRHINKWDIFFLKFDLFGYGNNTQKIGVFGRVLHSIILSVFFTLLFFGFKYVIEIRFPSIKNEISPYIIWGTIAGFIAALEINSYYQKWRYLADLFNTVITIDPSPHWDSTKKRIYSKREHLASCLAADILCMGMWNHKSFFPFFKETLNKAIWVNSNFNPNIHYASLSSVIDKPDYDVIKKLLSSYISWNRSEFDLIESIGPAPLRRAS